MCNDCWGLTLQKGWADMAYQTGAAFALRRSVHSLIYTLGATAVQLQLPAPPIANDNGEELGLRAPEFQWKPLVPVAVRKTNQGTELLVPADALEEVLGVEGGGAVAAAIEAMSAVLVRDLTFVPTGVEAVLSNGRECMYRIALRLENAEVV